MKDRFRIFKSGNFWKIEKLTLLGVSFDFKLLGSSTDLNLFNTKEEAQEAIDRHRRLEHKYNLEWENAKKLKEETQYEY